MKNNPPVTVKALEEKQKEIWKDGEKILLSAELVYFNISGSKTHAGIKRINRYYQHMNKQIIRYCKKKLLPQVIKSYKVSAETGDIFNETQILSKAILTYNNNGILSIFTDISENSGFGNITVRFGDVWNLAKGCPVPLSSFFPKSKNYKKLLKKFIIEQVRRLKERDLGIYFDNVRKNCSKHFSQDNYYITDEGLAIYYPMYTIAPRSEGIPTFIMKWENDEVIKPFSVL